MKSIWIKIAVVGTALATQGCMMKPQDIHIDPQVKLTNAEVGGLKVVGVEAHDKRQSKSLGMVGTPDARNTEITSKEDAAPAVYIRVVAGLKSQGFTARPATDGDDRVLRVEVTELSYQTTKINGFTDDVQVTAMVAGRARNRDEWQDRQFTVTQKKTVGVLPGVEENTRFVNEVLAQALAGLLSDPDLLNMLAR